MAEEITAPTGEDVGTTGAEEGNGVDTKVEPKEEAVPTRSERRAYRAGFFTAKQQAKPAEKEQEPDDFADVEDEGQRKLLERAVSVAEKRLSPKFESKFEEIKAERQAERDDYEISQFLGKPENAKFAQYESRARKYVATHPNYPIAGIFRDLDYDNAMANGATQGVKAQVKAKQQSVAGAGSRKEPVAKDPLKMSSKEFADYKKSLGGKLPADDE